MSWADSLLPCSFRGFVFDVVKTQDVADRATAEHSYPYLDGADIEDLGRGARVIALTAIFWGDTYETDLRSLLVVLDQPGYGPLVHPVFGNIERAQLRRYTIDHSADGVDQCAVALEFVEANVGAVFFGRDLPSQKAEAVARHGEATRGALATAIANVIDAVRNSTALASLEGLRAAMFQPVLTTFNQVQGVLLSGLDVLTYPRAWANDVSSVVDGVLNLRDFDNNLIADWRAAGNVLQLFDVFSTGSAAAPIRSGVAPKAAQATAAVQAHLACSTAVGYANAAGLVLAAEADPAHGPTLSPPEIESVVAAARTRIEAAMLAIRAVQPLEVARTITEPMKDQALALQDAARAIIEARPPLIVRTLEAPGNLRLVAHRWYADHTRAPELCRLNPQLRVPNNLQPGDTLNAYAR